MLDHKCRWCKDEVLEPEEPHWLEYPLLVIGVRRYYCPHCFMQLYMIRFSLLATWLFISLICLEIILVIVLPHQMAMSAFFALPPTILGGIGYALGRITGLVVGVVLAVVLVGLAVSF